MKYTVFSEIPNVINMTTAFEFNDLSSAIQCSMEQCSLGRIAKIICNGRLELVLC